MTRRCLALGFLFLFAAACSGDDSDDSAGSTSPSGSSNATVAQGSSAGETESGTSTSTQGSSQGDTQSATSTGATAGPTGTGASEAGGGGCVGAGEACTPENYCGSWACVCLNSTTEFMTIGSCEAGMCPTDGEAICANICTPNGGVMEATDLGCE